MNTISIYIHWPFCLSKCPYCDFFSVAESNSNKYDELAKFLLIDLRQSLPMISNLKLESIFFGGGTPSLMSPKHIEKMLNLIGKFCEISDKVEITMEANPATFSEQKVKDFKSAGINRFSLGIQSFQDKNLQFLGRIYSSKEAQKSAEIVANCFDNFSLDFMYGYSIQSKYDLEKDLQNATNLNCKHLSFYQLTFEEGTPFFEKLQNHKIKSIKEKTEIEFFKFINDFLSASSLNRYEISNYAVPGFESVHNMRYWTYKNYLGIGPAAHSRLIIDNKKFEIARPRSIEKWMQAISDKKSPAENFNELTLSEQLEETFIVGLRLKKGISMKTLNEQFSPEILRPIFSKIDILKSQKIILEEDGYLKLSERGTLMLNAALQFIFN